MRRSGAHLAGPGGLEQEAMESHDLLQEVLLYLTIRTGSDEWLFWTGSLRGPVWGQGFYQRGTFNPRKRDKDAFKQSKSV